MHILLMFTGFIRMKSGSPSLAGREPAKLVTVRSRGFKSCKADARYFVAGSPAPDAFSSFSKFHPTDKKEGFKIF